MELVELNEEYELFFHMKSEIIKYYSFCENYLRFLDECLVMFSKSYLLFRHYFHRNFQCFHFRLYYYY